MIVKIITWHSFILGSLNREGRDKLIVEEYHCSIQRMERILTIVYCDLLFITFGHSMLKNLTCPVVTWTMDLASLNVINTLVVFHNGCCVLRGFHVNSSAAERVQFPV